MRKRTLTAVYATALTILFVAGLVFAFYFAQKQGVCEAVACIIGIVLSFALAPFFHELGHIVFALAMKMQIVYAKFFCVKLVRIKGKLKMRFASPFRADETQAMPKNAENMEKRAKLYTLGGLFFSLAFVFAIALEATLFALLSSSHYLLWGILPYSAYLFLLNAVPLEYAGGKTDVRVYQGLNRKEPVETTMLCAMQIQGFLAEGKSFAEIDEDLYFRAPQLAEDEPLFAVMLDLRYRYFIEKGEAEKASDCLNRLINAEAYLPDAELEKVAGECVYMYSLLGDLARAEECGKVAKGYLAQEHATAKRILTAFTARFGEKEKAEILKKQAETALETEQVAGVKKFEKILLSRISLA